MSDREFENYLTLLASLLRLGRRQQERIAQELRAHLDDRLEELLAEGASREEATRRALAEFGDAAGLAAEFASIDRGRKRRWLMRVTTFSVAATILVAAGIVTFWPGRNAGPGLAEVAAQNADQPKEQADEAPRKAADFDPATAQPAAADRPRTVDDVLNKRSDFEFVEMPLVDVMEFISQSQSIAIIIKTDKLEEEGIAADHPVTLNLRGVRLSTALDLMLERLGLTYVEKEGELLLIVTTRSDAETTMVIRVYDCRDLLSMPWPDGSKPAPTRGSDRGGFFGGGDTKDADSNQNRAATAVGDPFGAPAGPSADPFGAPRRAGGDAHGDPFGAPVPREIMPQFGTAADDSGRGPPPREPTEYELRVDSLIALIETNVDPDSWDMMGGAGSISEYAGLVVITQTDQTHKKVERVLDMLRQAAGLEKPAGGGVVR